MAFWETKVFGFLGKYGRFLWFPNYEHFGFQGLHVANANGEEDRSFRPIEGLIPIRTAGVVR